MNQLTESQRQLVLNNLGLVGDVIERLPAEFLELESYEELFSIGRIGLIKTCQRFRKELGYRFSSYAVPLINGEIRHHFRKHYFGRSKKQAQWLQWSHLDALPNLNASMAIAYQNPSHADLEGHDKIRSVVNECGLTQLDRDLIQLRIFEDLQWKEIAIATGMRKTSALRRYQKALSKIKQWYISEEMK